VGWRERDWAKFDDGEVRSLLGPAHAPRRRSSDTVPAAHSGRICVTDPQHGRMCASYVVGERPADTLTRRIESLGLRVESSG
jgi:hypothetical protein